MEKFKVGDTAWVIEDWSNTVERVRITKVVDKGYNIHFFSGGTSCRLKDKVWRTKDEAIKAKHNEEEARKNKYRESIGDSKKELLDFMLSHLYCAESPNYEAITVIKEKCLELFGIDLED